MEFVRIDSTRCNENSEWFWLYNQRTRHSRVCSQKDVAMDKKKQSLIEAQANNWNFMLNLSESHTDKVTYEEYSLSLDYDL